MSLMQKIRVVMDMFVDTNVRIDIANTLNFLFEIYSSGKASEDQIREDLFDLFINVLSACRPDLLPEERRAKADSLVEEFIATFKLEGLRRRTMAKYRSLTIGV